MGIANRVRALFLRGDGDIGLLRSSSEVLAWTHRLPRVRCGDVRGGERGWFAGRVRALEPQLSAPFSLRPSIAVRVRKTIPGGRYEANEVTEFEAAADFLLDDGTGVARVSTGLLSLHTARSWYGIDQQDLGSLAHMRERSEYLARSGSGRWVLGMSPVQYEEFRLVEGDPVVVLGAATVEPYVGGRGGGYREAVTRPVLGVAPDAMFLYVAECDESLLG